MPVYETYIECPYCAKNAELYIEYNETTHSFECVSLTMHPHDLKVEDEALESKYKDKES